MSMSKYASKADYEKAQSGDKSDEQIKRAERRVLRAARAWFDQMKPRDWSHEKHLHAPACNATSDANEALARAVATHALLRRKHGRTS